MSEVENDGLRWSQNISSSPSPQRLHLPLPPYATEKQLILSNNYTKKENKNGKALKIRKILPLDLKELYCKKQTSNESGLVKKTDKTEFNNPYEAKFTKYSRISDLYSPLSVQKS